MTNQHYHMIKSFQLCGNMMIKNCFSSSYFYDPTLINHKTKTNNLKCTNIRSLPRELTYPINKDELWNTKYDFIIIPKQSSLNDFDSIQSETPREQQISQSLTDITLNNSIEHTSSSLPNINNDDGKHIFIDKDDKQLILTDRSEQLPISNTILRLRTIIGLTNEKNILWTNDGNFIVYSSNSIVIQMNINTQQQEFFIGHTDKVSGIALNGNSSLLATIQAGTNGTNKNRVLYRGGVFKPDTSAVSHGGYSDPHLYLVRGACLTPTLNLL